MFDSLRLASPRLAARRVGRGRRPRICRRGHRRRRFFAVGPTAAEPSGPCWVIPPGRATRCGWKTGSCPQRLSPRRIRRARRDEAQASNFPGGLQTRNTRASSGRQARHHRANTSRWPAKITSAASAAPKKPASPFALSASLAFPPGCCLASSASPRLAGSRLGDHCMSGPGRMAVASSPGSHGNEIVAKRRRLLFPLQAQPFGKDSHHLQGKMRGLLHQVLEAFGVYRFQPAFAFRNGRSAARPLVDQADLSQA